MTAARWQRLKDIYSAAAEMDPSERSSFLRAQCAEDSDFRAELEDLLSNQDGPPVLRNFSTILDVLLTNLEDPEYVFSKGQVLAGRFEILRHIGRGGMGDVYSARDVRMSEFVAIKTIRPRIEGNPRGLQRFLQEIRLSRQITHPNVCRVFDLEVAEAGGQAYTFFTMELLEGESLREWIAREAPAAPERVLPIAAQFLDGLGAAHARGIVHRDFKPSNVILAPAPAGTRAVVTDFGIAYSASSEDSDPVTQTGSLLGTPLYMAPEQLEGRRASASTDMYAVGLVLYEMVTGRRPFADDNPYTAAVQRLKHPPVPPGKYVSGLDPLWEDLILRCLSIDPEGRPASAAEVRDALQGKPLPKPARLRRRVPIPARRWLAMACIIAGAAALAFFFRPSDRAGAESTFGTLSSDRPRKITSDAGVTIDPAITADGGWITYASDRAAGNLDIWAQPASGGQALRLTDHPEDDSNPSFSPDGKWIVFRSDRDGGGVYLVPRDGGPERFLASGGRNPKFSPDGKQIAFWTGEIRYTKPMGGKIFVVPMSGGSPRPVHPEMKDARYPAWSPDGQHLLFQGIRESSDAEDGGSDWWVCDPGNSPLIETHAFDVFRRRRLQIQEGVNWYDDVVWFAAQQGDSSNIWRLKLNRTDFHPQGEPLPLTRGSTTEFSPSLSRDGTLIFVNQSSDIRIYGLTLANHQPAPGQDLRDLTMQDSLDTRPSVSADGTRVAFGRRADGKRSVWLLDLSRSGGGEKRSLADSKDDDFDTPVMSSDGSLVAYSRASEKGNPIFLVPTAGGSPRRVCGACGDVVDSFADNQSLLYFAKERRALNILNLRSGRSTTLYENAEHSIETARLSPQNEWIALSERIAHGQCRILLARLIDGKLSPRTAWIPITEGTSWDDKPAWDRDGAAVYFYSSRDGFGCIWKQELDPLSKQPVGPPVSIKHLHESQKSLANLTLAAFNLSASRNMLVMNVGAVRANVWATQLRLPLR
jgi:serine/threonine protein kinase/Tol biopolymer transport system component